MRNQEPQLTPNFQFNPVILQKELDRSLKKFYKDLIAPEFKNVRKEMKEGNEHLRKDLRQEMKEGNDKLKAELRHEMKEGNGKLREELRQEMKESNDKLREELRHEMKESNDKLREELRHEMKENNDKLRQEMKESNDKLQKEFKVDNNQLQKELGSQFRKEMKENNKQLQEGLSAQLRKEIMMDFMNFYNTIIVPRFEKIEKDLQDFRQESQSRFDDLYHKFDDLHQEYTLTNLHFSRLEKRVETSEIQQKEFLILKKQVGQLETKIELIERKLTSH